jgi:RNA polymerase sigma factor (sigma-70 family)
VGAVGVTVAYPKTGVSDWAVLFSAGAIGTVSDAELLARFTSGRGDHAAEAAFAALVGRHGPMVLGVCRRVTGDAHAADDAFQAVFLILARKARAVVLGADDSLGRWLYGVSVRVARRARLAARGKPVATVDLDGLDPVDQSSPAERCELVELRAAIDAEIARLPVRYRSAVVLCHLEGLSQREAARRLRCPVGTVESRLHRARERLRSGLARGGVAPAVGAFATSLDVVLESRAEVPAALAKETAVAAARIGTGATIPGAAPAAVAELAGLTLRRMIMRQLWKTLGLILLALAATSGAVALATLGGAEPLAAARADDPKPAAQPRTERPRLALAEKLDQIKSEYQAADREFMAFYRGSTIPEENRAKAAAIEPDFARTVRRIADLAATAPKDPVVRDIMLWVIQQSGGGHAESGEFALAATWLVRNHGDDPDAVRVGLELDNWPNAERDHLLLRFYTSAKRRESKGLARLALAQYLERKSSFAEGARKVKERPTIVHDDLVRADGTLYTEKEVQPDEDYAYLLHLKQCDAGYLRAEAERLYEEVIAEYADVPHRTVRQRELEELLKQPAPKRNGKPLTDEAIRKMKERLARRTTLGEVAEARLDNWHNLAVGKPAPEINAIDIEGKPLKLSSYRGNVVALVFWGSWCGPCMREVPREKSLVERMKGRPFAMLGVNVEGDAKVARKVMEGEGMNCPNWNDGEPGEGPIVKLYHVRGYPTVYVIDADGRIRAKDSHGRFLDELVEKLVTEREAAGR